MTHSGKLHGTLRSQISHVLYLHHRETFSLKQEAASIQSRVSLSSMVGVRCRHSQKQRVASSATRHGAFISKSDRRRVKMRCSPHPCALFMLTWRWDVGGRCKNIPVLSHTANFTHLCPFEISIMLSEELLMLPEKMIFSIITLICKDLCLRYMRACAWSWTRRKLFF